MRRRGRMIWAIGNFSSDEILPHKPMEIACELESCRTTQDIRFTTIAALLGASYKNSRHALPTLCAAFRLEFDK